jgi:hypothetical protein
LSSTSELKGLSEIFVPYKTSTKSVENNNTEEMPGYEKAFSSLEQHIDRNKDGLFDTVTPHTVQKQIGGGITETPTTNGLHDMIVKNNTNSTETITTNRLRSIIRKAQQNVDSEQTLLTDQVRDLVVKDVNNSDKTLLTSSVRNLFNTLNNQRNEPSKLVRLANTEQLIQAKTKHENADTPKYNHLNEVVYGLGGNYNESTTLTTPVSSDLSDSEVNNEEKDSNRSSESSSLASLDNDSESYNNSEKSHNSSIGGSESQMSEEDVKTSNMKESDELPDSLDDHSFETETSTAHVGTRFVYDSTTSIGSI